MKKKTLEFNTQKLMQDIRDKSNAKSLGYLATENNVSASSLSRLDNGEVPGMEVFIALCESLELNPSDYFDWYIWEGRKL